MAGEIKSNTGNAQIKQQGHTTNGKFGGNPNASIKGSSTPKDLRIKAS